VDGVEARREDEDVEVMEGAFGEEALGSEFADRVGLKVNEGNVGLVKDLIVVRFVG
jgi:hypothetical protein